MKNKANKQKKKLEGKKLSSKDLEGTVGGLTAVSAGPSARSSVKVSSATAASKPRADATTLKP